ncbi:hypothetical protein Tco_1166379 [Tanacetum coccineum]
MSIPDEMMNDRIKNSVAYQTYVALSIGTKPPKKGRGKGKGLMSKKAATPAPEKKKSVPKKKGSITAEENILSDPDKALQLGESISLTEIEIAREERRLHETHASLVIGREPASEVDKDVVKCQKKKKIKGIASDTNVQELLNLKKATRKSREDYILQQIPKGSSEGSASKPEVPDKPKGRPIVLHQRFPMSQKANLQLITSLMMTGVRMKKK